MMTVRTLTYMPFEYQAILHKDTHRFKIVVGGRRAGKSKSCFQEMLRYAITNPNSLCWWVAPTYSEAREIGYEEYTRYEEELSGAILCVHKSIMRVELTNGSKIYFKGADRKDSLRGRGLDFLVVDEAAFIEKDLWTKVLRPALSDKRGRAILISTPNGRNWFYLLHTTVSVKGDDTWKAYHWPSSVNPLITHEEISQAKDELSNNDFRQEYLAEFVTKAGQVYDDFSLDNIIHDFKINPNEHYIYIGADFGYANPAALVFVAVDPLTDTVYQFDEIYEAKMSMQQMVDEIDTKLAQHGLEKKHVRAIYTDPAGNAEEITSGISPVDYLRGTYTVINKGTKIAPGLQLVRSFILNANGHIRYYVHERCKETTRSLFGYTYKTVSKTNTDLIHEEPDKDGLHDHACDALRYFFVNAYDNAKWITDHIEQHYYTNEPVRTTVIKRCPKCKRPFASHTPKDKKPFICKDCMID